MWRPLRHKWRSFFYDTLGRRWKTIQGSLLKSLITDILDYCLCISITDTPVKFPRTPEMSFWVSAFEVWFSFKQFSRWCAFQKLKSFWNAHCRWKSNDCVDMIWHHTEFGYFYLMSFCNRVQNVFTKLFIFLFHKHVVPILGTPFQVIQILANAMATAN